jgi:hypothetical protein
VGAVAPAVALVPFVCVVLATACTAPAARAPESSPAIPTVSPSASAAPSREERWAEDVSYLVDQMETLHPDLYHGVSRDDLARAVDDLVAELPTLDDDEVLVRIMRLVAMISSDGRDGHMGVWPPDNPEAVHRFPIRVWQFPEGLFVTAARAPNEALVGSRILSVDGMPLDEVFARLDPVVPRDNSSNLRAARTVFLTSAEVLSGLGVADDRLTMNLEVEARGGVRRTAAVDAVDAGTYADWVGGWELPLPERAGARFLRDVADPFRLGYLRSSRALYVQYNLVEETSSAVVDAMRTAMRRDAVERVVLDLRNNGGGEAGGYRDLLRFLARPEIDGPGRLFVLVDRLTFSAAASLAVLLERGAEHAVFVGEPTGGAPNFWADPVTVTLPNSGLHALVSSRYFGIGGPSDMRSALEPDLRVAFTSSDYFSGRDPVLEAALG